MADKIDWERWRLKYVSGGDDVTLEALSKEPGAPALSTIKKRSAIESWADQRRHFRNQIGGILAHDQVVEQTVEKIQALIDSSEMLTRHLKAIRLTGSKGLAKLAALDPQTLTPREALDFIKYAIEVERLIEGLATSRQEIDLTQLSDADLERLAAG